jgi:sugar phosphate isomerase/epimerase
MKLGAMNSPERDIIKEIQLYGEMGFDFIDLAIEGPNATPDILIEREREIRDVLSSYNMFVVGHTPWFFEIGHPYRAIQKAFIREVEKVIEVSAKFGVEKVGLHIRKPKGLFQDKLEHNIEGIRKIVQEAENHNITICLENLDILTFSDDDLQRIFDEEPKTKFLFDIGHANIGIREEDDIFIFLWRFKDRLAHVHAHDNLGGTGASDDLHLPIGVGNINWKKVVGELKKSYDGTVTLEIHAQDRDYLKISREKFLALWRSNI